MPNFHAAGEQKKEVPTGAGEKAQVAKDRYSRFSQVAEFFLTRIAWPLWFLGIGVILVLSIMNVGKAWLGAIAAILVIIVIGSWALLNGLGVVWGMLKVRQIERWTTTGRVIWGSLLLFGLSLLAMFVFFVVTFARSILQH